MRYRIRFILLVLLLLCSSRIVAVEDNSTETIYVVNHGWHTGILVSADAAEAVMPFLRERFVQPQFYEFGWGDQAFYQADEIGVLMALKAILLPTDSVVHVVAVTDMPGKYFARSELVELDVSVRQLEQLSNFIASYFVYTGESVESLGQGIYGDSQFYRSDENYHLFNTCNGWTAQAMQATGIEVDPAFVFTAGQVMSRLRRDQ